LRSTHATPSPLILGFTNAKYNHGNVPCCEKHNGNSVKPEELNTRSGKSLLLGVIYCGLIGGKQQAKPEESLVTFTATEGTDEKKNVQQRFTQSFSSRAPHFFPAAIRTNQSSRQPRCFIHGDPTRLSYRDWLVAPLFPRTRRGSGMGTFVRTFQIWSWQ